MWTPIPCPPAVQQQQHKRTALQLVIVVVVLFALLPQRLDAFSLFTNRRLVLNLLHSPPLFHASPLPGHNLLHTRLRAAELQKASEALNQVAQDLGKQRDKHAAIKATTAAANKFEREKRKKRTKEWRVILCNDDLHTFKYVTESIVEVIPIITRAKAHTITVEAHKSGMATVLSTWKQKAEQYSEALQRKGLSVSLAPDKDFDRNKKA